jgi:chemotaxis family two-component system response regulator Rcp1
LSQAYQDRITRILLIEDNKIDARLTSQALQQMTDWPSKIEVVDDGDKALKFLRRENAYAEADEPDVVILDLNLPKRDGAEVLQFIRTSESLQNVMVFIFSSSPADVAQDRLSGAHIRADSYFEKPDALRTYLSIAVQMKETYKRAASLSRGARAG